MKRGTGGRHPSMTVTPLHVRWVIELLTMKLTYDDSRGWGWVEGGLSRFLHRKRNPVMILKRTAAFNNLTYSKNNRKIDG